MTKIVVLSDTHGNLKALNKLIDIMQEADLILFAGDGIKDLNVLPEEIRKKVKAVKGNCDFGFGDKELLLNVEESKILLCHGDLYNVKSTRLPLLMRAKELDCNVVVYGHTHERRIEIVDGITFINPGELIFYACEKTFAYLVINGKKVTATINENFFNR